MYAKYIIECYTYSVTYNIAHLTYIKIYRIKPNLHSVFMVIILHTKSVGGVIFIISFAQNSLFEKTNIFHNTHIFASCVRYFHSQ